ncbi:MAG: CCA tRNA nucleotidyltransferase [Akkermansia sp.]|nr:CCA tRNA nucleotidyltransferase [Akkermansia sp.]
MILIPSHALTVVERLERYGYEAYVVGGCVRDSLLGRNPKDWDVCTNALPEEVLRVFKRFHVIKTGLQHGTVTVMVDKQPVEVTTFRIDGAYTDNRHPDSVNFVSRVEEDLARRDFTINAMAYNPTRGLVDAFDGQADLKAGVIRCVGEPDARFNEDGLRILRALRFAARYNFGIETETAFSIHRNRHLLENVSVERIFTELKGILIGEGVLGMMQAFPDVFAVIIPELAPTIGFEQHNPHHCYDVWTHTAHAVQAAPADEVIRLALLLHDIAKPATFTRGEDGKGHFYGHGTKGAELARSIMRHLKSDIATLDKVVTLVREHDNTLPTTAPGMRRCIGRLGLEPLQHLLAIKQADMDAQSTHERPKKQAVLREARLLLEDVLEGTPAYSVGDLALAGRDLIAMGLKPGPAMGSILKTLLAEVQDEMLSNTREALEPRAIELIKQSQSS